MTQSSEQQRQYLRQYLRSPRFITASWLCVGLCVGSFFVSAYRLWLLYAACAVSIFAMLPILMRVRNRNIDLHQQGDRTAMRTTVIGIGTILLIALLYG